MRVCHHLAACQPCKRIGESPSSGVDKHLQTLWRLYLYSAVAAPADTQCVENDMLQVQARQQTLVLTLRICTVPDVSAKNEANVLVLVNAQRCFAAHLQMLKCTAPHHLQQLWADCICYVRLIIVRSGRAYLWNSLGESLMAKPDRAKSLTKQCEAWVLLWQQQVALVQLHNLQTQCNA